MLRLLLSFILADVMHQFVFASLSLKLFLLDLLKDCIAYYFRIYSVLLEQYFELQQRPPGS